MDRVKKKKKRKEKERENRWEGWTDGQRFSGELHNVHAGLGKT